MYQPFNLSGRSALITGGNGGIGYGMARALLQAGASVSIWGSNADKTANAHEALARECGDAARVHSAVCDVGDEAAVEQAFAATVAALGPIRACFANAGVSSKGTVLMDMSLEEFRRVQRINVEGVFLTLRTAARHMAAHGGGSLVATASTAAVEGAARNSHYGASKGAVTSMVRALAVELARHQIRVNSILPGWIETEMTSRSFANEKFAGNVLPRVPARRWGSIDDFGGIAVYLASDAAAYTTGEQFVIDGGYTKF
ncbi:SDR family NAD(P)-dependent oxidoreductase [Pseudorhodoferax sp.]|uniref:SDR family NAD(P)-dependent oxidoreductase n=1 Tax=Pseudorhodoferax sp. TaxID=1993553 RepID=UPI002DD65651|nr:SDR family NAD(P)-dependent oxidoreductase [Pseudorhodoferax sp.]